MPTLHWLTRDTDIHDAARVPYRLLAEAPDLSAGDPDAGNLLIQGDNLEVLKALLPFYAGQVKCVYIDPPYNTRSAFEHYDDEEVRCAQVIDSLSQVAYWIRNVARHSQSFWLPTTTDRFYPDFVARLVDGRLLVVEYKGAHIAEGSDTAEKRTIGALWQQRSGGQGLFVVIEKDVNGRDARQQLEDFLMANSLP